MDKESKPMISVLVPLYNVEKYIARCLDSILNQSFQNFEIVIVNDGSLDSSIDIALQYAEKDNRIKIIYNDENMGLAWARKVGYSNAVGQYIVFCDSDDYLPSIALEILYDSIKSSDAEIVVGNYQSVNSNNEFGHISNNKLFYGNDQKSVYKSLLKNEMSHSLWGKIYKIDLFKNKNYITHKHFVNSEDGFLFYQIIKNTIKVETIADVVYYYFQNDQSSTRIKLTDKAFRSIVTFWNLRYEMFINDPDLNILSNKRTINSYCKFLKDGYKSSVIKKYIKIHDFEQYIHPYTILKLFPFREAIINILFMGVNKLR